MDLDSIINALPDAVFAVHDNRIAYASRGFADLLGYPDTAHIVGKPYTHFLIPSDIDRVKEIHRARMSGMPAPQRYRISLQHADGASFVQATINVKNTEIDGEIYSVGSLRDAEEYTDSAVDISKIRRYYRHIVNLIPSGLFLVDSHNRVVSANESIIRFVGCSAEEAYGAGFDVLFGADLHPEADPVQLGTLARAVRERQEINIESLRLLNNGHALWVDASVYPISEDNPLADASNAGGCMVILRDVSQRVVKEKQHYRESALFEELIEAAPEGVFLTDSAGVVLYANPRLCEIFGYKKNELVGHSINILLPRGRHHDHQKKMDAFVRTPSRRVMNSGRDLSGVRSDGTEIPVEVALSYFSVDEERLVIGFVSDLTYRREAERSKNAAARRAQELSTLKSTLLANLNHEFRTPMNGILGFTHILKQKMHDAEDVEHIELIRASASRLMNTLNNIIVLGEILSNVSKPRRRTVELEDLSAMIDSVATEYRFIAEKKGIHLYFDSVLPLGICDTDLHFLEQVVRNIVDNAVKFTHSGSVKITLGSERRDEVPFLVIQCADTGVGMTPEFLSSAIEPFRQESEGLDREFEGMGVGLTIIHSFARALEAPVTYVSEKGRGTCVRVSLPIEVLDDEADTGLRGSDDSRRYAILVVSSGGTLWDTLSLMLGDSAQLRMVASESEALQIVAAEPVDVVFCELSPASSMEEFTSSMRGLRLGARTPVIAVIAPTVREMINTLLVGGFTDVLIRPFSEEQLYKTVSRHIPITLLKK